MALYAFDGTWNIDEEEPDKDTNVVKFLNIYAGPVGYRSGVGTRWGGIGRALGGLLGLGGRSRIEEMHDELAENYRRGDHVIDIIGFSRGSALAVHFANVIADEGIKLESGEVVKPNIRFLGIWDLIGSFGLNLDTLVDFQRINLGWKIDSVPNNVALCFHAMALDERQETFNVTRLNKFAEKQNIHEVWFRGNHSDVGGGNENPKRSNIALAWMLEKAIDSGLPIHQVDLEIVARNCDTQAPFIAPKDLQIDHRRKTYKEDSYHPSAMAKKLAIGESFQFPVYAKHKWNWSGILLEKDCTYRFDVSANEKWMDGEIQCDANGWKSDDLPWYKEEVVELFEHRRRCEKANWFELVGSLGDDDRQTFPIGKGGDDRLYTAPEAAELFTYANDLDWKYENNEGKIVVTITRVS